MTARSIILGRHFGLLVLHFRTLCLRWIVLEIALRWNTIDYSCRQSVILNMHWSVFDTHESELTLWIGALRVYQYKHVSRVYVVVLRVVSTCNFVIESPKSRSYVCRKCIGRAHRAVRKSHAAQMMVAIFERHSSSLWSWIYCFSLKLCLSCSVEGIGYSPFPTALWGPLCPWWFLY